MNVACATRLAKENLQARLPGNPPKLRKFFQPRFSKAPDSSSSDRLYTPAMGARKQRVRPAPFRSHMPLTRTRRHPPPPFPNNQTQERETARITPPSQARRGPPGHRPPLVESATPPHQHQHRASLFPRTTDFPRIPVRWKRKDINRSRAPVTSREVITPMKERGRPHKCPYCRASNTIWKGYRPLRSGKNRIRLCKACRRKFTPRKKTPPPPPEAAA